MEQPKAMEYGSWKASPDVLKPHIYMCVCVCIYICYSPFPLCTT